MAGQRKTVDERHDAAVNRQRAKTSKKADEWKAFVQLELTTAQKVEVKKLRDDADRLFDSVFGTVEEGYKLTFSLDTYNNAYVCSLTGKGDDNPNNGLTLSGRGGSILGAMASLWYKHDVVLERDWTSANTAKPREIDEDDVG